MQSVATADWRDGVAISRLGNRHQQYMGRQGVKLYPAARIIVLLLLFVIVQTTATASSSLIVVVPLLVW